MKETVFDEYACLRELEWDTKYFGLACAKAVLYKPLTIDCWNELKRSFRQYQFVCIENRNSEPINAQLIGRDTSAFLADVNIQFSTKENIPERLVTTAFILLTVIKLLPHLVAECLFLMMKSGLLRLDSGLLKLEIKHDIISTVSWVIIIG